MLFTENETNTERLARRPEPDALCQGWDRRLPRERPARRGQPRAGRDEGGRPLPVDGRARGVGVDPPAAGARSVRGRARSGADFDALVDLRRAEADEFYATVIPATLGDDAALVMRQALAGMLWSQAVLPLRRRSLARRTRRRSVRGDCEPTPRNQHWHHMLNADVISMPDKWEYPWFAAWDLAFHSSR